jgi:hypothetical protein
VLSGTHHETLENCFDSALFDLTCDSTLKLLKLVEITFNKTTNSLGEGNIKWAAFAMYFVQYNLSLLHFLSYLAVAKALAVRVPLLAVRLQIP